MRVAIVGARDGKYVQSQIEENTDSLYTVIALADNNLASGNKRRTDRMWSVVRLAQAYHNNEIDRVIIAVRKGYSRYVILNQLKELGIDDAILVKPSALTYRLPLVFNKNDLEYNYFWYDTRDNNKPILHHMEMHVANGCNLNCRGCLHFSNLFSRNDFPDLDSILSSIIEISKNCEIFQCRILGGEPLLNPNLSEFLKRLRGILPTTDIAVISNGILIPTMKEELLETMRKCHIGFNLTLYPPTIKMKSQIYDVLDKHNVAYGSHEEHTGFFEKYLTTEYEEEDKRPYTSCVPRGIVTLREGKLYRCPVEAYIGKYNERFEAAFPEPEGIEIESVMDWSRLIDDFYLRPRELCYYCSKDGQAYPWDNGKAKKRDWIVD